MACVPVHVSPLSWFLPSTTFLSFGTHTFGVPDTLWLPCRLPRSRSIADSCQVVDNKHTVTTRQRLTYAHNLIHHIIFAEIMTWDLGTVQQHISCHQSIVCPTLPDTSSLVSVSNTSLLFNSRCMDLAVVKVGGSRIGGTSNEVMYFLPSVGVWRYLTSIPHPKQCKFATAVLDNDLYVVGGCFGQCRQVSYILFYEQFMWNQVHIIKDTGCLWGHCTFFRIICSMTSRSMNKAHVRNG